MYRGSALYIPAVLFVGMAVAIALYPGPLDALSAIVEEMTFLSYAAFVLLLVVATVLMPVTVMPLIPMASAALGPFITGVLSVIGWTIGAVIAFLISRYLGRPIIERFADLERIDSYVARMPKRTRIVTIIVMRLTIPVDIASYALGLSRSVTFFEYTLGTFIGVIWFSFAFAYLGEALLRKDILLLVGLSCVSLAIFLFGWYFLRRSK